MNRCLEPLRRKVLDIIAQCKPMKHVTEDPGLSQQTLIDKGERQGSTSVENAELASVKQSIRRHEEETRTLFHARELLQEVPDPKGVCGYRSDGHGKLGATKYVHATQGVWV